MLTQADNRTIIDLPAALSVNNLHFNKPGKGRVPTDRYQTWKRAAQNCLLASRARPFAGPVVLSIWFGRQDRRRRDLDNRAKCVLDLLVNCQVIEADDDRIVRELHLYTTTEIDGCRVAITSAQEAA